MHSRWQVRVILRPERRVRRTAIYFSCTSASAAGLADCDMCRGSRPPLFRLAPLDHSRAVPVLDQVAGVHAGRRLVRGATDKQIAGAGESWHVRSIFDGCRLTGGGGSHVSYGPIAAIKPSFTPAGNRCSLAGELPAECAEVPFFKGSVDADGRRTPRNPI